MKRISLLITGLIVSFGVALGVSGVAQAGWSDNIKSSDNTVTVKSEETHQGSLYVGAGSVIIDGVVAGDLYCASNKVVISGTVEGDVICGSQSIEILKDANVRGDIRVAAQYVTIEGEVGGSVTALAQDVRIEEDAQIGKELNGFAQMTTLDGTVSGGVVSAGQVLNIGGTVNGDIDASYQSLELAESASIEGSLNYSAARAANVDESRVNGEVVYNQPTTRDVDGGDFVGVMVVVALAMFMTALIVALLAPRFLHRSSEVLRERGLMTVLLGFAVAFGGPLLVGMTMLTVFLTPLAIIMLLAWLLISALSGIFLAYYIGSVLLRGVDNIVVRMLGGATVLLILYMIPIINVFVVFVAWVVGSGMIVMTLTNGYRRPEYSLEPTKPVATKPVRTRTTKKKK